MTLATVEPATLTLDEADELADHEAIIEQSQAVFVEVGNALMAIRDARLYRATHATFDAYLAARWPTISKRRGYQLIDAAAIAKSVPITNERQARALKGVPTEHAKQAFQAAAQATNGQPTGKAIEQALKPEKHANGLPVDFAAYEAKALSCNLRLVFDGEYHVTGAADGPRHSSAWAGIKQFIDASEKTYQLQAQALAAVERTERVRMAQATLTTPIADAYAAGREAELEPSDPLPSQEMRTAMQLRTKLMTRNHNLMNRKEFHAELTLVRDYYECLLSVAGLPSAFEKAIEAVLTQAADLLADDDYADLAKRLDGVQAQ